MFHSLTVRNFRCFLDLTVQPLERVNLIAGKNNVGKTSLLEAIFLFLGPNDPELTLRISEFRGIARDEPEEIWRLLFYRRETHNLIELIGTDQTDRELSLRISLEGSKNRLIPKGTRAKNGSTGPLSQARALTTKPLPAAFMVYKYQDGPAMGDLRKSVAWVRPEGLEIKKAPIRSPASGVFLPSCRTAREEDVDAARFSELEKQGRHEEVLSILRILEPRLKRLSLALLSGIPMIHGDIGMGHLTPLPLLGEGMQNLLSIVLAIVDVPKGVVLVDEVENGIHHSAMIDVWKAIAEAARRSDTQVFATTHSWECIRAAHEAFSSSENYDFRLHRLERDDGDIKAITLDREMLQTAVEMNLEVR